MKFDLNKEMKPWLKVLNNNVKWSAALIIRIVIVLGILIMFLVLLKWTGVTDYLKTLGNSPIKIKQKDIKHNSKPSTPSHKSDIIDITKKQEMIKNKIKKHIKGTKK